MSVLVMARETDVSVVAVEILDSETARLVSWLSMGAMEKYGAVPCTST